MAASVEYINTQQWSNLFQVSPCVFNVSCALQEEEFLKLSIINSCNDCIAWKLKTNRPGRYMVSPKQGIILAKQQKDCTVVLSKLKQVPDTKKPDKFLIQATKVNPHTKATHLPQLWKERESKHDKKRHVFAYQSVTIKCFLNIEQKANIETMDTKTEIYVPAIDNDNNNDKENVLIDAGITPTDTCQYNEQTVAGWRKKALQYDELFQFTRKTLAQRDELNVRWKTEETKTRSLEKLNRELNEEKKHVLNEDKYEDDEEEDYVKLKQRITELENDGNVKANLVQELKEQNKALQQKYDEMNESNIKLNEECKELQTDLQEMALNYSKLCRKLNIDESNYLNWDSNDVTDWIISLDPEYAEYEHTLRAKLKEERVDGLLLADLDKNDLHRIGIKALKHKIAIIKHINRLTSKQKPLFENIEGNNATAYI